MRGLLVLLPRGLAVAAVGKIPLGVDAETPRTVRDVLMRKVCAPEEICLIQAEDDQTRAFSRFWTLKDAYAKYTGEGIWLPFAALRFSFGSEGQILFHYPDAAPVRFWQRTDVSGCIVSLCLPDDADIILKEIT